MNTNFHKNSDQNTDSKSGLSLLRTDSSPNEDIEEKDTGFDNFSVKPKPVRI